MSRKDYRAFADIIVGELASRPLVDVVARDTTIRTLRNVMLSTADMFKRDNASFDRARFYTACGFDSEGFAPV